MAEALGTWYTSERYVRALSVIDVVRLAFMTHLLQPIIGQFRLAEQAPLSLCMANILSHYAPFLVIDFSPFSGVIVVERLCVIGHER